MTTANIKLDKPFGVLVKTGGRNVLKQFETQSDVEEFIMKLEQFENVEYEILERPKTGIAGRPYSPAFVEVVASNVSGGIWYKCIKVRPLKGHLFCTECHEYRKFISKPDTFGNTFNCCPVCDMPDTDFNIKTANGTWPEK